MVSHHAGTSGNGTLCSRRAWRENENDRGIINGIEASDRNDRDNAAQNSTRTGERRERAEEPAAAVAHAEVGDNKRWRPRMRGGQDMLENRQATCAVQLYVIQC